MNASWSIVTGGARLFMRRASSRFSLPSRRPVAVAAVVLVAVLLGAFGAAAGSWLGNRGLTELPDTAGLAELTQRATGVDEAPVVSRQTSPHAAPVVAADIRIDTGWDAAQARQRYAAAGWSVSPVVVVDDQASVLYPGDKTITYLPSRYSHFTAESQGLVLEVSGSFVADDGIVRLSGWAANSPAVPALALTGAALGLITGWLLAATMARRIRPADPAHRATVKALTATALLVLAAPAAALYLNLGHVLRPHAHTSGPIATVHSALTPGSYWPTAPTWLLPVLCVAGTLVAIIALALAAAAQPAHASAVRSAAGGDWEVATSTIEASIAAARVNRDAAQQLLFLLTYPDWAPTSVDRIRHRLINAGVPAGFLTTPDQSSSEGS
ncbi:hypothetical protein O7630_03185 [Micromonospora sp. WMMD718]|uniref:hypothetical protein n=1 Tax=Micromonospora sp. WMMD718 TaxID=3016098 RepID=UPI0024171FFC|nr:hypothetical protein [Micromonospora sp. WMMD718]MDG4749936.1 hypothetical protein [Micromonospora sp. WMMD718]